MLRREHQFRANLGRIYSFSRGLRMDDNGDFRRPDVLACEAYARQTLDSIVRGPDDPFGYRLLDLWLDVFQRPWDQPTNLDELLGDLAEKIGSGELRVYLEYDPNDCVFDVSAGGGQKASSHGASGEQTEDPRTQKGVSAGSQPEGAYVQSTGSANEESYTLSGSSKAASLSNEAAPAAQEYESTPMKPEYFNEDNPDSFMRWNKPDVVKYLEESEKDSYELDVRDGLITVKETGLPFDTADADFEGAIFVMEPSGRILASNNSSVGQFHHSSLAAGEEVGSAGHMHVADGHLLEVTNVSGHYAPDQSLNDQLFDELERKGMSSEVTDKVIRSGWTPNGLPSEPKPHKYFRDYKKG